MNTETTIIKNLLSKIATIDKNYDLLATTSGINFNLISILNMETNERYTHSAIIAELLNPKGKHGQGNLFLELFFNQIGIEDFENNNVEVIVEKYVEEIYNIRTFIDIYIKDNQSGKCVLIENKINALDQPLQLERYATVKPHTLIYLTLNGDKYRTKDENLKYSTMSYKKDIVKWLEKCIDIVKPISEKQALAVEMYLDIIKKITNQSIYKSMEIEIKKIILQSKENLMAAQKIHENFIQVKQFIANSFWFLLEEKLKESGFEKKGIINKFNYSIEFDYEDKETFLGIRKNRELNKISEFEQEIERNEIVNILKFYKEDGSSSYWPTWFYPPVDSALKHKIIENMEAHELFKFYNNIENEAQIISKYFSAILNELKKNFESSN